MRRIDSQRHFSDELLLSHADGELFGRQQKAVSKHLKECWECRTRLAEIEQRVQFVAKLMAGTPFPSVERKEAAIRRFLARKDQLASLGQPDEGLRLVSSYRAYGAAALLVVLSVAGFWFWIHKEPHQLGPWEVLQHAQVVERTLEIADSACRQVFQVEVRQVRPRGSRIRRRLEVWTDTTGGRHSSRWSDPEGRLLFAVWRPTPSVQYVYDPKVAVTVAASSTTDGRPVHFADFSAADIDRVEETLLRWIRGQAWRPALITSELSVFIGKAGAVLRAERFRSPGRESQLRLVAERSAGGLRMEFILEIEPSSYRPRLAIIRLETLERAVEVRLAVSEARAVAREQLGPAVFHPDRELMPVAVTKPRASALRLSEPTSPVEARGLIDRTEIEVLWALHRVRACLREHPEIRREDGRIRVRALASEERRLELQEALASVSAGGLVDFEIGSRDGAVPARERTAESVLSEETTRAANSVYLEALALVKLAERYETESTHTLPAEASDLLETMTRDHLAALRLAIRRARERILPEIAALPDVAAEEEHFAAPARELDWSVHCFALFRVVDRMDDVVQALAGAPEAALEKKTAMAASLRAILAAVEQRVSALEVAARKQFVRTARVAR